MFFILRTDLMKSIRNRFQNNVELIADKVT